MASSIPAAIPEAIASHQHDHAHCIETALIKARAYCQEHGLRLTPQREQIFRLVWQSHKPLGAYTLMDMLSAESTRRIAPPTVYRALDFLLEHQLIHRIHSLNAFVGCTHPDQQHGNNFMICEDCGIAIEFSAEQQNENMTNIAQQLGFEMKAQSIEVVGRCKQCCETGGQHGH